MDNGGTGTISEFPTGVWVDPQGVLRPLMKEARTGDLAALRANNQQQAAAGQDDARRSSPLRMVSLTRLEKQIQLNEALGQGVDETMKYLAGLRRIEYVFVYPETGDLVRGRTGRRLDRGGREPRRLRRHGRPGRAAGRPGGRLPPDDDRPRRPFRLHDQSAAGSR